MIKSLIKSLDELRSMRGNYATYEDLIMRCYDIANIVNEVAPKLQLWEAE